MYLLFYTNWSLYPLFIPYNIVIEIETIISLKFRMLKFRMFIFDKLDFKSFEVLKVCR